jgi:hypothetical protein
MPRLRLGRGRAGLSGAPAFVSFPAPSAAAFSFAAPAKIRAGSAAFAGVFENGLDGDM